jgi:hypothetical protein
MKIKPILLLTATVFFLGGCKKGYFDINEVNPNQTQNPPLAGLLSSITYQTGINYFRAGDFTSYCNTSLHQTREALRISMKTQTVVRFGLIRLLPATTLTAGCTIR